MDNQVNLTTTSFDDLWKAATEGGKGGQMAREELLRRQEDYTRIKQQEQDLENIKDLPVTWGDLYPILNQLTGVISKVIDRLNAPNK